MRHGNRWLSLFGALAIGVSIATQAVAQVRINEIRIDNPGTDTDEYFELKGTPGTDLTGYFYIVIGDGSTAPRCGVVESVTDLGTLTPHIIPPSGYYAVCKEAAPTLTGYTVINVATMNFENTDNVTHLLVQGWTGTNGQDLDTNDDGILDITPWTTLVDCIAVNGFPVDCVTAPAPAGTSEYTYCTTSITNGTTTSVPMMVWRCEDTGTWNSGQNDLPPIGVDSPGAANQTCATPSPTILKDLRSPCAPLVNNTAVVTDSILFATSANVVYSVNGGAPVTLPMSSLGSNKWQATLPAQSVNGTRIAYHVEAFNGFGSDTGFGQGYFVGITNIATLRVNDGNGVNQYKFYGVNIHGNATSAQGTFSTVNTDFYMQDATGGINIFQSAKVIAAVNLWDELDVTGAVDQFNGKLELNASSVCGDLIISVAGPGSPIAPKLINSCQLNESMESFLVRMQYPLVDTTGATTLGNWGANKNAHITSCYPDTVLLFVDVDTDIDGTPVRSLQVDVSGIANQFDSTAPYTAGYEITPRGLSDIIYLTPSGVPMGESGGRARLFQNAPNPFSKLTTIQYQIPKGSRADAGVPVRINLYDVTGRKVATLLDAQKTPGVYSVTLDADQLGGISSGIFFYDLVIDGQRIDRQKVVLAR